MGGNGSETNDIYLELEINERMRLKTARDARVIFE